MKNIVRYFHQSLSLKLSIGVLLMTALIFFATLGIVFVESRRNIRQESIDHAASVLNNVAQNVSRYLNTVETATNTNSWLAVESFNPDSLINLSRRILLLNGNVDGCSITAAPGLFGEEDNFSAYTVRKADTIVTVREEQYDYYEKEWYRAPVKKGKACWVDPFDDNNPGKLSAVDLIASYCKPLYNIHDELLGVISTDILFSKLEKVMMEDKPYPNSYFIMLGSQGHFFVHPDSTRLVNQTIFNTTDAKQHQDIITLGYEMISGKEGCMRVELNGKACLVSYRSVPNTPWSVALVSPEKDVFRSYHRLTNVIILLVLLSLIPIFLFCHRIVNRAIRPLNRLLDQTQRIAAGDYSVVIPHTKRFDVVGRMQNSFAMMQESINRHVSDIQLINKGWVQRNEELHRARQLIEESDRQKTIFIQNVTHQIRTPLNIILGFAQIMRDSVGSLPLEEVKGFIGMMKHNALSLNRMVLMLYDSSESGATEELNNMHLEPISCNELIRSAIDATHYRFPDLKISLETVIPDSVCIKSDNVYLMRSLRELLYNSAKYSDGKHISVQVSANGAMVRFVFTDTGRGISDDYFDKVFIPFSKVDDLSEGLGLGLPLAKRHIDNLGGKLILDRDYREGCRFIVELPIS